ncbi:MAG: threonine-phosphate decarboxylase [Alphaproteobacteria bacterium]|nr:threonine-phosphate decarboxylase [Alphaproteobacteria bacterium]
MSAEHGGRLAAARRRFPAAPEPFLDLSTGVSPHPYPRPALPEDAFTRLPEPEAIGALEAAAARAYGLADPAMAVAAPGTQALISLLPRLVPLARVAVLGPTYAEHAACWRAAGAAVVETGDPAALAAADGAVLCNPNNPDGYRHDPLALRALAAGRRLTVIDEAFADPEPPGLSLAPHLPLPGVVVLRSFGKFFGLPGLRLGFALAEPARAAAIRAALGPWPVSGPAIATGTAALADIDWQAAMRTRLAAQGAALAALLRATGLDVLGGTPLFCLAAHPRAAALCEGLGARGILVRRFAHAPTWLRFGLPGTPAAWARLRTALIQVKAAADRNG